ncbi:MAG: acyl-CoA thioesterase [Ignavibacteriaceae bacterium]|nr:acyl-CoA thioesterase [Ignavibacteriaceae bacterium]
MLEELGKTKFPKVEIPITVKLYDVDAAGHVNNTVYVRWLEDMRTRLFTQFCSPKLLLKANYYLVVVSCRMKYKKQIKLFQEPIGRMTLVNYKHGVFTFEAIIKLEGKTVFHAVQECVLMNLKENKMYKNNVSKLVGSL